MAIAGIKLDADAEAVVVAAAEPLRVVSSAVLGGGIGVARTIVNVHVAKGFHCADTDAVLRAVAERRQLAAPVVGMLTGAATEKMEVATTTAAGLTAVAVVTVGLSNATAAGRSPVAVWQPSTINTILIVDADPEPAALVNLIITVTEAKALALAEAGIKAADGTPASGTSTDAVTVAATGRGPRCRFGGPVSELGWVAAGAARWAVGNGVRRWIRERR
jgi:iron complex transport system ATP-binding protein